MSNTVTSPTGSVEQGKPLCEGAWAIPPSPLMLENGNNYHTCSVCGEKADAPREKMAAVVYSIYGGSWGTALGVADLQLKIYEQEITKARLEASIDEAEACDNLILNNGPYARKLIKDRIATLTTELKDKNG